MVQKRHVLTRDHTVLPATYRFINKWPYLPLLPSRRASRPLAGTHFTIPRWVEGWVDLPTYLLTYLLTPGELTFHVGELTSRELSNVSINPEKFLRHKTCVSKVEPQRPEWNNKISSPLGSPISRDKRWNVDRGTTIRRRQNLLCASRMNAPYSLRQRCIPAKHDTTAHQPTPSELNWGLLHFGGQETEQQHTVDDRIKCKYYTIT